MAAGARLPAWCCVLGVTMLASAQPTPAATLRVGQGQLLHSPSEAAASAQDGDTIIIEPGEYFDCSVWQPDDLTIAGDGPGVVLTDKACQGKAAFVVRGRGVTVRDITFTRIRVADRNGAGIRAEGSDLTVERVRFVNNEIGILAADAGGSSLIVRDCDFADNVGAGAAVDVLAGRIALLRIERSRLGGGRAAPSVTSYATRTELAGDRLDGRLVAQSAAPYLLGIPDGGSLDMQDNEIVMGGTTPRLGAVLVAAPGLWPSPGTLSLRGTAFANRTGSPAVLLRNWSGRTPVMADNAVQPGDVAVTDGGRSLYLLKQTAHRTIDWLHQMAAGIRHAAAVALRHLGA